MFEELTDTSVLIALRTGAPALCQVNYGTTTEYGLMRRMSMTEPMDDHRILLPGLKPDTIYHVRLTTVDTGSRLYQSGDLTFRTKPSSRAAPAGRNVATLAAGARAIGVSSNYGGAGNTSTFGANNAIDGDAATEWSSNGDGDKAWSEIELRDATRLVAIGFWTRAMGSSAQIHEFEVVADRTTRLGSFTIPDAGRTHRFPVDVTAKRLRFNVLKSSGGNTGAVEIEALAAP
ncbi:MAG: discoidin domain-containing protein [Armatimonadota bacterium]|nr:discoidin domain-containing protein [Armatimonadota bacterium]